MPTETQSANFPIRELVQRTGVNASTLRAWENRHGILKPQRTPSGHRLYSQEDVLRVRRLQELLVQGFGLGEISELLARDGGEVGGLVSEANLTTASINLNPAWEGYVLETLRALADFSTERLDSLYNEACALYPIGVITQELLIPVLQQLGLRWDKHPSGIAEEHFFSAWLRNKLGARLHHSLALRPGRPVILACLPQENHEIGLLIFSLGVLDLGYRVIYLGANMPTRQIIHVSNHTHALGIVLVGRGSNRNESVMDDVAWLARTANIPVFVGSHISVQDKEKCLHAGARPLGNDIPLGLRLLESQLSAHPGRPRRKST
jgi:DNA-binding transcriptional MerR regulator/methylmalonyl-CoA mutase cobalamin-binding subunit